MNNGLRVLGVLPGLLVAVSALAATPNAPMRRAVQNIPDATPLGTAGGTPLTVAFVYSPINGVEVNKGVAAITNPATGVFCVTPRTRLKAAALPIVTVEWGGSSGFNLLAFWDRDNIACLTGDIEVRTYDFNAGAPAVASQLVAFSVDVE